MIKDYATYEYYFQQLQKRDADLNDFIFGDSSAYINMARNLTEWPILWLTEPAITEKTDDNTLATYSGEIRILASTHPDDIAQQKEVMNKLQKVAKRLKNKLMTASEKGHFNELIGDIKMEPISGIIHSHDVGWELIFQIEVISDDCGDPCDEDEDFIIPWFRWSRTGDIITITEIDETAAAIVDIKIINENNMAVDVTAEIDLSQLDGIGDHFIIEITQQIIGSDQLIYSAARIAPGMTCGSSLPYQLKF